MNAWASLSCLCITFWQVSIYSSAACMQKALSYTKKRHLLESVPSEAFFPWSFLSVGALSCPGSQDASSSPPPTAGQGRSGMWWCSAGRVSSGPSQIRVPSAHRAEMILYVLFNSWGLTHTEIGLSLPLSPSPAFPWSYFLILITIQGGINTWK